MKTYKKKIFITGSSSGLGFFLAKQFSKKKYHIIINGKNKKKLIQAAKLINSDYIHGDMSNLIIIKKNMKKLQKKYKSLDIIIANLGNSEFIKNNKNISYSIKKNLLPTVYVVENSISILKKNSQIICISSICGSEIIQNAPIGYSVSKAALNFYVKSISRVLSKSKIFINAILPGNLMFEGSTWHKKIKKNKSETIQYINQNVPTQTFGAPEDIFKICELLCNNNSGFINGSLIKADGGQTLSN